jgi:hypothetical protein
MVSNGWAHLNIPPAGLTGTSDATTFTITGIPAFISPVSVKVLGLLDGIDNTAAVNVVAYYSGSNVITLYNGHYGTAWTNSGTKTLRSSELSYAMY